MQTTPEDKKSIKPQSHRRRLIQRIFLGVIAAILLLFVVMYGIGWWYRASQSGKPSTLGVSFVPAYAESLGLDAEQTMDALIKEVGVRDFRLVSYWNQLEPEPGKYDFSLLDWQFKKAEESDSTVTLALGLRQPRWPECHMPAWAEGKPQSEWQPQLEKFMTRVIERYKDSPALISYQLENEYFIHDFGMCKNFDRKRLIDEFELVKKLDEDHPVIISRSNNLSGWPMGKPQPDIFATSIYRRVWNDRIFSGYFNYPVPAWYYSFIAGWQKLATGRDMMIHELQAEPWPPHGQSMTETSLEEQDKSFNATMLPGRVQFAERTGMRDAYLWGGEYWYYRKVIHNDESIWKAASEVFLKANRSGD